MLSEDQKQERSAAASANSNGADALATGAVARAVARRRAVRPGIVLLVASIGVFMAFIDDTVVGIAFPNLLRSFPGASLAQLSWVLNAYNIAFAAFLVPAGRFADLLGRRRLFGFGVVLFTVASALCAIAPSIGFLIAARAVQGIGAAVIVPSSLGLVLEAHAPAQRAQAVAMWAATAAVAAGIGPSIGGLLVHVYNWRLVFLVNLPIGVIAWRLAGRALVESRAPGRRVVPDLTGALVLAAAVAALTLAIVQGPVWGWTSPAVIVAALAALGGAVIFARRCRWHSAPVLDVELLRAPGFGVTAMLTAIGSAGFFALGLANVLYLMVVWRYSPLKAGLALTPAPFVAALAAGMTGRFGTHRDRRVLVFLGAAVWTAGPVVLLARMGPRPDYLGAYLPAAVLLAIGIGVAFPLVSDAAVSAAPRGRFAGASALNGAIRQVGAAMGVAILAALLGHAAVTGTPSAFHRAWIFAGVCFALVATGALGLRPSGVPDLEDLDEEISPRVVRTPSPRAPARDVKVKPRSETWVPETSTSLLAEVPLFAELEPGLRDSLAQQSESVRVRAGEWLFRQGDSADALFIVRSGRLEVIHEGASGTQEILRELGRGSVVGELALLSQGNRSASVRCRRDAELLRLDRGHFTAMLETQPGFGAAVSRVLGGQLQRSRRLDAEPATTTSTVAIVALSATAAAAGVEPALVRELTRLTSVAHLDRAAVQGLDGAGEPAFALARTLERLERDHDLIVVSAGFEVDPEWSTACVRQADRVLLLVSDAPAAPSLPLSELRGCDVALLEPAVRPGVGALLDGLEPRSTHRVARESFTGDVARLARRMAGRAVGLVLSGGGARGFAHIGVIEELLGAGIVIDRVGGASMGAFVGALLAQGMDAAEIDARCYEEWVRRSPLGDYRLPRYSLLRGARALAMLERNLPGLIEDLPRSFYTVSADLIAAELVVHRRGELSAAVGASMCIPGVVPPVALGGRLLIDGGVLDNLPVTTMAAEAEGPVIASDVNEPEQRVLAPGEPVPVPTLMDTLQRVMLLGTADTAETGRRHADLYIAPDQSSVGRMEFHMLDTMRESGRRAALSALETAPGSLFG
jgi:NTE family protein